MCKLQKSFVEEALILVNTTFWLLYSFSLGIGVKIYDVDSCHSLKKKKEKRKTKLDSLEWSDTFIPCDTAHSNSLGIYIPKCCPTPIRE